MVSPNGTADKPKPFRMRSEGEKIHSERLVERLE